jgi:hypothetical protein
MGFGLGRATIGARHFSELQNVMLVESYFGIIAAEMGVLGIAVFGWVIAAILALIWKMRRAMASSPFNLNWLSLALFVTATLALLPVGTPIDASPGNLYFWFFLGMIVKMYDQHLAGAYAPQAANPAAAAPMYPEFR